VRASSLSIAVLILATAAAQAGVSTYPSSYHPRGSDYYENLRSAKVAWLRANLAAVNGELTSDRSGLAALSGHAAVNAKATIDRLAAEDTQIQAELKVMSGGRDARQGELLKRNVQSWIGAARRGGNGAEAIRLMRDLEGTGL
jgi:deoxyribodipyrimidine photolyase